MRPTLRFLDDELIDRIVDESRNVLGQVGVEVLDESAAAVLQEHGAAESGGRVLISGEMVDRALASAPSSFALFDAMGEPTHDFAGGRVHFAPASSAILVLDPDTGRARGPQTADYLRYAKVVAGLPAIHAQSTAFIPADVDERVSDSYRLFLSLLTCSKPVVTGAFSVESLAVMHDLLVTVRGSAGALAEKPLAIFSCCPTSPLKWTREGSANLMDCARASIPVEIVPVPLSGFMAPVTVVGTLVQHTAEVLSGVVMGQIVNPGAPMLFGGCPAIFDMRFETAPMGAVESQLIACGAAEIGRRLGMPAQGYIGLSDAKTLDAQAGLESSMGTTLAALGCFDNVSGPGMLDFINCHSTAKLVVDHELCLMAQRLRRGVEPRDDFPTVPLMRELLSEGHLIIAEHSMKHVGEEIALPGPVIDRAGRPRWVDDGKKTLEQRVAAEVERLLGAYEAPILSDTVVAGLEERMTAAARLCGMDDLPARDS
ncbi:MAG: trimethylamine methyltransferase family protein [Thermoanaerobaculales bacterium]|jgi:trimethylamine--corrinoid protein Co-methyltransferase|nr:trimethylamine methyltransferase family protein [Thermoanaerobaculales bacterium]